MAAHAMSAEELSRLSRKLKVVLRPNALNLLCRRFAWHQAQRSLGSLGLKRVSSAIILAYHRVTIASSDPQLLSVSPAHFAEHLAAIRELCRSVPLREVAAQLENGSSLERAVAVTFDDGYADNLYQAKPLLERYGVPATVFVASSQIGSNAEFWWDELDRLVLQPGSLPPLLRLSVSGREYVWDLQRDTEYDEVDFSRNQQWHVLERAAPTRRHELYLALCSLINPLPSSRRREVLDQLRDWAGAGRSARATHRPMTESEIVALADNGCVQIGGHTESHPVLSTLPVAEQKTEIVRGKQQLERILGKRVTSFAYPYGAISDYKGETVKAVREAGFECACSTFADSVRPGCDRFQLPRFTVRDWDGEQFARRLRRWMGL